jgi:hypothetical protein
MSCFSGYFTLSGCAYFLLFIAHSFAYYGFRISDDPIDIRTDKRKLTKSSLPRTFFKWAFIGVSVCYFVILLMGRITYEYSEVKTMMGDTDHKVKSEEVALERAYNKVIPDFFSTWTVIKSIVMMGFALILIPLQEYEQQEAELNDEELQEDLKDLSIQR